MKRKKLLKLTSLFLSLLMCAGAFTAVLPVLAADEGGGATSGGGSTLQQISDTLNAIGYEEYAEEHKDTPRATDEVTIYAVDYDKDLTDADVKVVDTDGNDPSSIAETGKKSLLTYDTGKVTWKVNIPKTGKYAVKITYKPEINKANSIERMFYINDKIPFAEARYLAMTRVWQNLYEGNEQGKYFERDSNDNDKRPETVETPEWREYSFTDSNGFELTPFEFFFEAGENTISLEGVREYAVIQKIILYPYEDLPSYEEYLKAQTAAGAKDADGKPIQIDAEYTYQTSHNTIYPIYDRTSAISDPQDPVKIRINSIGSDKWQKVGQWVKYQFKVDTAGLYTIALRFKQSELSGLYVSRRLYIDDEIPFAECNELKFEFDNAWQSKRLGEDGGDGDVPYKFYLTEGVHTLTLEVTLGDLGESVRDVKNSLSVINDAYLAILKLTGTNPDQYRDYGFSRVIPGTVRDLVRQGKELDNIVKSLEENNGVAGENTATLADIQRLVEKMASDEDEIARNLTNLKSYIGTLGTWINTVTTQPLEIDYIMIQPESEKLPRAEANFFQSIWFEIRSFIGSFYTDYNSLGSTEDGTKANTVDVWVVTGRDQATIIRNLIDNTFKTETNSSINLKLVAGGTLLPSVLAGVGPDVSLFTGDGDVINYAIRGALQGMNDKLCKNCKSHDRETLKYVGEQPDGTMDYKCDVCGADGEDNWELYFESFDEVTARFSQAATIPLTLYGETFAIPETQTFPMLFYRKDILSDLNLEVPKTWEDVKAMIPVLQYNNMEVGLTTDYVTYLYQMGGEMYADNGMRVNLDSNLALDAFAMMCNMFTMYKLPYSYDFANRFRTGEIPIAISPYTSYNQLTVFATEIAGLWEFTVIPGMEQADGTINNTAVAGVAGVVMLEGSKNKKGAWEFIDWYTDADFQAAYSNELVAVLGAAGMNPTANREAIKNLSWTSTELANLEAQFDKLSAVPNYPGSYIIGRYTNFAFLDAYNNNANPTETLLSYINTINKEFTRKREEFELETLEIGETLAEKRVRQATEALDDLDGGTKDKYADAIKNIKDYITRAADSNATKEVYDELTDAAVRLRGTDTGVFDTIATYLEQAADAYRSYL